MTPPLLLFDLDGTLVDSLPDLATATNAMRAAHHLPPLPLNTIRSYIGNGIQRLAERAIHNTPLPLPTALNELLAAYTAHLTDATRPMPGVDPTLQTLKHAGCLLGVVTNKPAHLTRRLLDHLRWTPLLSIVLGGGDTPSLKPHPAPILEAMRRLHTPPHETWMIGDNYTDLEAAHHARVPSIFLENGYGKPRNIPPTLRLPNFPALLSLFPH